MNIHMPADIIGEKIVQGHLDKYFIDKPKATLDDVIEALGLIDEYVKSISRPVIRVGKGKDYAGKIAVLMAGGTNGGADVFKTYFEASGVEVVRGFGME
ncbi:MAG: hypothetical protein JJE29_06655 [Peptostreptococcaceae bacterium]|nr:hypothetical protein [Peptostreptococcaceae bacterium]